MTNAEILKAFSDAESKVFDAKNVAFYDFMNRFSVYVRYNRDVKETDITNDDMQRYLKAFVKDTYGLEV